MTILQSLCVIGSLDLNGANMLDLQSVFKNINFVDDKPMDMYIHAKFDFNCLVEEDQNM